MFIGFRAPSIMLLLIGSSISSCALFPPLGAGDLRIASVEKVQLSGRERQRNMIRITTTNLSDWTTNSHFDRKDYICVALETKRNFIEMTRQHEFNLACVAKIVDAASHSECYYPMIGTVFEGDTSVNYENPALMRSSPTDTKRKAKGFRRYQVYFQAQGDYTVGHINSGIISNYNLLREPKSIELFVRGGNMIGQRFESNHVILPAVVIAKCLQEKTRGDR